jgi:vacuolar-type H+-ATPase subunit F/Vma7
MLGFVIGDSEMVTGFMLVGVLGTEVTSVNEAQEALEKALARNDLALVLVSEEFSTHPQMQKTIDAVRRERISPLIVEVPASSGKLSKVSMSDLVSKTLGVRM